MKDKFVSRKLVVTCVAVALIALNKKLGLGLDAESILSIAGACAAYVAGQAVIDAKEKT